ncbi:MAG: hypothetical protein IJH90_08655 [Mogibacterium sp.]|nr:hypothetical protein [Mogibacterium sp.]
MIHLHTFDNMRITRQAFDSFVASHTDQLERVKTAFTPIVILKNDEEHHFIPVHAYGTWCRGRTYMYYGVLFHSGIPAEEGDEK